MCPGEVLWDNDLKEVSWLRTNCNSLIPKEKGTKNNQEIPRRTILMERREGTVALLLSQPTTEYRERENGLNQQHEG